MTEEEYEYRKTKATIAVIALIGVIIITLFGG